MENYTKVLELPTKGKYGAPTEITIRNMTLKEEKILTSFRHEDQALRLISSCVIEPENFDPDTLTVMDQEFILFNLRELTFGAKYNQDFICPYCGHTNRVVVDISKMTYTQIPDDIDQKLTVTLPISKKVVHLKAITNADDKKISERVKRQMKLSPESTKAELDLVFRLYAVVESIEGVDDIEKEVFLDKLHMMDVNAINQALQLRFGLDTSVPYTCSLCGEEVTGLGTICPEFFRPTQIIE